MTLGMVKRAGPELELQNWSPVLAAGFAEVSNSLKIYALHRVDGR